MAASAGLTGSAREGRAPEARRRPGTTLPTGTVTFLITDIQGSTGLVLELGEAYGDVLDRHNALLRGAVASHGGTTVSTAGDSVFAVFPTARGAAEAAVEAQRAVADEPWPDDRRLLVRMGIHTGEASLGGDDYVGLDVHRAARISAAAHGGQVLVSASTAALLGSSPGLIDLGEHRLKDLVHPEHLYQLGAPGLRASFPPLRSLGGVPVILPMSRSSFVPRPEVDAVASLLEQERLVTLTGPGGTGKTRLAVEVGRRSKDAFSDGVVFVGLAGVRQPALVPAAVVDVLGLTSGAASPSQRLKRYLDDRCVLLVLDNFEQVLDAADLVAEVIAACPRVTVLVTSRSPLRLSGEQEFPVPPLETPQATRTDVSSVQSSAAGRLFVERARRVRPAFQLTPDNAPAVAAIARQLDGLPLALELAAARIRLLPAAAIAQRLAASGSTELTTRERDVPARQRTLRAVISWSYDLLSDPAQRAFRRLAPFVGGARLEETELVLDPRPEEDVLDLLAELAEQSLLRQEESDAEPRFTMLLTIAEFAAARLADSGEENATRTRHADAYLALAEEAAPYLTGWEQRRWLDRLERDHDNLRAALHRCVRAGDADRAQRLTAALWRFWQIRGHLDEGAHAIDEALALPTTDEPLRARALEAAGGIAWWRGDIPQARQAYQEALEILEPTGDPAALSNARYNLALALGFEGTDQTATAELYQARREAQQAGDRRLEAWAVWGLSDIGVAMGDWDLAARSGEEALTMFRELDDPFGIGWSLFMTASSHSRLSAGDRDLARRRFQDGTRLFASFRDLTALVLHCRGVARLEAVTGRMDRALRLIGASNALRDRTGAGLLDVNEALLAAFDTETTESLAASGYTPADTERLIAEGARFSPDEAVAYILEELPDPDPDCDK